MYPWRTGRLDLVQACEERVSKRLVKLPSLVDPFHGCHGRLDNLIHLDWNLWMPATPEQEGVDPFGDLVKEVKTVPRIRMLLFPLSHCVFNYSQYQKTAFWNIYKATDSISTFDQFVHTLFNSSLDTLKKDLQFLIRYT